VTLRLQMSALIGLLLLSAPFPAAAQNAGKLPCGEDSEIVFARVLMERLCRVAKEPTVYAATKARDANSLMATLPSDVMWRVGDQTLISFLQTYERTLAGADPVTCASAAPEPGARPWGERFMAIALTVDDSTAEEWADFIEAWVRAKVANAPRGREASAPQVQAFLRTYISSLSQDERVAYLHFARRERMEPEARCAVVKRMYHAFSVVPLERAAAVFRTMMTGQVSWLPAA
jgi:hypothetical protein